jgi:RNA-binding protein YhbY
VRKLAHRYRAMKGAARTTAFVAPTAPRLHVLRRAGSHPPCVRPPRHDRALRPVCALSGRDRRTLRSEAGRREAAGTLAYVRMPLLADNERMTADSGVVREVCERLRREEIVRVKTADKKKRLAAASGAALAQACGAHVAQVIGHTVLIYRPADDGAELAPGLVRIDVPAGGASADIAA